MNRLRVRLIALTTAAAALVSDEAWALQGPTPGSVSAEKLKLPDAPGSVRGLSDSASVSVFSGQINYSVPIDLPKGRAGFGPALSLTYHGELGNGPVGVGWRIGTMAVRRSQRHGVPSYTDTDEIELDGLGGGGRLVASGGSGASYTVEGQGRSIRVERQTDFRFHVVDNSGTRYSFGLTENSKDGAPGRRAVAHLEVIEDVSRNQQIEVHYKHDKGQTYLDTITWGPNGEMWAEMVYEPRPDVVVSWRTGYEVRTAWRLREIVVHSFGEVLRRYKLSYESASEDPRFRLSRLSKVEMSGLERPSKPLIALPPLTFRYGRPLAASAQHIATDGWVLNERGTTLLDVDGDGMSDLARLEMGNHQYKKSLGSTFGTARSIAGASGLELRSASLLDIDGDARSELVRIVDDKWRYSKLLGSEWVNHGEWPGTQSLPLESPTSVLADVNGDGRTDLIRGTATSVLVNFGTPNGMSATQVRPRLVEGVSEVEPGNRNVRFHDVNGDGLVDVVWMTDAWMKLFLGRGDGTFAPFNYVVYPWDDPASGLHPVLNLDDIRLADLDGDGLLDLIRIGSGNVQWFQGKPDGTFGGGVRSLQRPEGVDSDAVVTIADVNGNGSQDVVWSSADGIWLLDFAGSTSCGMLVAIENGLGKTTVFDYSTSALLSVADEKAGVPWEYKLPASVAVPVAVTVVPSPGEAPRVARYVPRDGFWDGTERRLGGFLTASETQVGATPVETLIAESRFLPGLGAERVLRGKAWFERRSSGSGYRFTETTSEWAARPVTGLNEHPLTRRAGLLSTRVLNYEGTTTPADTRTKYELDGDSRPTMEVYEQWFLDAYIPLKTIERSYADDPATGVRDKPCEEKVWGQGGALASQKRNRYLPDSSGPFSCVAANGWVHRVESYLSATLGDAPGYLTESSFEYDRFGNPTQIYDKWVTRRVAYDPNDLYPAGETLSTAESTLVWEMEWDEALGLPTRLKGPTGDASTASYDGLGRITAVAVNGRQPHVCYGYDWRAPHPRTITEVFDGRLDDLASHPCPDPLTAAPTDGVRRHTVAVTNGAGEELTTATWFDNQWIVSGWKERNERGLVTLLSEPFYAGADHPATRPTNARVQTMGYDALGRLRAQTLPNGAVKTIQLTAPLEQTTASPELAEVKMIADGLGRIIRTERSVETGLESVDATYDGADRITLISLQGGQVQHSFVYDTLGRLRSANDPDVGHRTMSYEPQRFGLLTEHVNAAISPTTPDGQHVYFEYDELARLRRRAESAQPGPTDYVYQYDRSDENTGCRLAGHLAKVNEPNGSVLLCYDELGRQSGNARTIITSPGQQEQGWEHYEYSPSGLLLATEADDGFALRYAYDRGGRPASIVRLVEGNVPRELWAAEQTDASGRVVKERFGNGTTGEYQYDQLGLASDVKVHSAPLAQDLFHISVERNTYGAPKMITDMLHTSAPGGENRTDGSRDHNATYAYDSAGRLVEATVGRSTQQVAFAYGYDALQNMVFRQACAPAGLNIGILQGAYRYGEPDPGTGRTRGPRQLTSVQPQVTP